jgi:signal transduction histidine kinase
MTTPDEPRERRGYERRRSDRLRRETLDRLVQGVAHDLNNVLGVLLVQIDRLERTLLADPGDGAGAGIDPAEARGAVDGLYAAVAHGEDLSAAITVLSRDHALDHEHVDLNEVVRATADLVRSAIPPGIDLDLDLDPSPCWALVLRGSVERVLLNGTLNAVQAMPDGGRLVVTSSRQESDESTGSVVIELIDDGLGVDDRVRQRAFEPSFTTRRSAEGHGVGLTASRQLVTATGGTLDLTGAPGEGSVLRLRYPAAAALEPAARRAADAADADQRSRRGNRRRTP